MIVFIKDRWVLFAVLILFISFKIPHLLYPFYWDECTPYVAAIKAMYHHGVSFSPSALNPDLSRGHPLFFHVLGAIWIHIFGESNLALHCFALFISLLFLITIYEASNHLYSKRVAIISLLLISTNVAFFVQSSFVLLEILVAFLAFLSIYLYIKGKYFLATLSLTALFLTKESGIIVGFVIGVDGLVSLFNAQTTLKTRLLKLLPVTVACITIGIFFIAQKQINGWYVFPLHSETILRKWADIWYNFGTPVMQVSFCVDYYYCYFFLLIFYSIIMIIKNKTIKNISLLSVLPLIIFIYLMEGSRIGLFNVKGIDFLVSSVFYFSLFIMLYFVAIFSFARTRLYANTAQTRFIILSGLFILCYGIFSSAAFFTARYIIASTTSTLFLLAIFFDMLIRHSNRILYPLLIVIIFFIGYFSFKQSTGLGDTQLGFRNAIKTQSETVSYLERNNYYDKQICSPLLGMVHLTRPSAGFVDSDHIFKFVATDIDSHTEFVIINNIEPDEQRHAIAKDTAFQLVHRIVNDNVWMELYKKK